MSQPTPIPAETHAAAGAFEHSGKLARREAAVARASRRLRVVTDLGDMAMTLAKAVHERALAEEVAAKAALAVREAAEAEPGEEPPVPARTAPSRENTSQKEGQTSPSVKRTRAASRSESRMSGQVSALDAGVLFTRLSDIVRQCLELEIRIDEELRRLEAALFVTRQPDGTLGGPIGAMVEAVIEEEAKTWQEVQELYTALHKRLDEDEAYRDLDPHPGSARWSPQPDP